MTLRGSRSATQADHQSLRRVGSKRSLATSKRSTKTLVQHKLRRLYFRIKLSRCFSFTTSAPAAIDYFTTRLPPEIRLEIYSHILQFDVPLALVPRAHGAARARALNILQINRLIYTEALPVFYNLNAISATRAAFCTKDRYHPHFQKRDQVNHDLVRNLYICDLAPSSACAALMTEEPTPAKYHSCVYCDKCLLPLIRALRDMTRLQTVTIEYHDHAYAIRKLAVVLSGVYGRATGLQLTCTGIGTYNLSGAEWFPKTTINLQHTLLSTLWRCIIVNLPAGHDAVGDDASDDSDSDDYTFIAMRNRITYLRTCRKRVRETFKKLQPRFSKKEVRRMLGALARLLAMHDIGLVPSAISSIWPFDLPMDFRRMGDRLEGRGAFLHQFNLELQKLYHEGRFRVSDFVPRRMG